MRRTYDRRHRAELIRAVRERGEATRDAARRLGVTASTAFRWLRVEAEAAGRGPVRHDEVRPTFVELVPVRPATASLVVRVGAAEIEVGATFDAALLRAVVAALSEAAP
jgi:transposase-like protein